MFDFVTERSAEPRLRQPGAGLRRALHHGLRPGAAQRPAHRLRRPSLRNARRRLPRRGRPRGPRALAVPRRHRDGGRCWAHPAIDIAINGKPLDPNGTYKIAVNDYIAKGGSGFTRAQAQHHAHRDGHLPARLADRLHAGLLHLRRHPRTGNARRPRSGQAAAATLVDGKWVVDDQVMGFCRRGPGVRGRARRSRWAPAPAGRRSGKTLAALRPSRS